MTEGCATSRCNATALQAPELPDFEESMLKFHLFSLPSIAKLNMIKVAIVLCFVFGFLTLTNPKQPRRISVNVMLT